MDRMEMKEKLCLQSLLNTMTSGEEIANRLNEELGSEFEAKLN